MLNTNQHATIMKNILRDIYSNPVLQAKLVFKGGTCLYFFHDLDRFSTDLDFSLRQRVDFGTADQELVLSILKQYLSVADYKDKHFTWFWLGSYERGQQKIKVEISKRQYLADQYMENDLLGLTVPSFDLPSMFAHKLCAITDRHELVNRDLYDAWWMFKKMTPINQGIVQERTGQKLVDYLRSLPKYIKENAQGSALLGLGEVLSSSQKDWVRDHLLEELLFQIELRVQELIG